MICRYTHSGGPGRFKQTQVLYITHNCLSYLPFPHSHISRPASSWLSTQTWNNSCAHSKNWMTFLSTCINEQRNIGWQSPRYCLLRMVFLSHMKQHLTQLKSYQGIKHSQKPFSHSGKIQPTSHYMSWNPLDQFLSSALCRYSIWNVSPKKLPLRITSLPFQHGFFFHRTHSPTIHLSTLMLMYSVS